MQALHAGRKVTPSSAPAGRVGILHCVRDLGVQVVRRPRLTFSAVHLSALRLVSSLSGRDRGWEITQQLGSLFYLSSKL